jgi:hypothetical protein
MLLLLFPEFRAIHIGFVATGLRKEVKFLNTALPAISFENRDDIRGSDLPILWIPWIKEFIRFHPDVNMSFLIWNRLYQFL